MNARCWARKSTIHGLYSLPQRLKFDQPLMPSRLTEFTSTSRFFESQARLTQVICWVAVAVNLLILLASPESPENFYLFLAGTSFGLTLLFKGSLGILSKTPSYSRTGRYLHEQFDHWFPLFQFWVRYILILICLTAIWVQVLDLGLQVSSVIHIFLGVLLFLLPFDLLILDKSKYTAAPFWYRLHEVTRFLITFSIFALIALIAQAFVPTPEETYSKQVPLTVVLIWTPVFLIILSNLIVLVARLRKDLTP